MTSPVDVAPVEFVDSNRRFVRTGAGECMDKVAAIRYTATDACGNAVSTDGDISFIDTAAPVINTPPTSFEVEYNGLLNDGQVRDWIATHGSASATSVATSSEHTMVSFTHLNTDPPSVKAPPRRKRFRSIR